MPKKGTLTKAHIVKAVIEQSGFTQKKSFETVETRLEILKSTLESGDNVMISGFGKFCVKRKHARLGRNPATGEHMLLAKKKIVTFQCSRILKEKLNRKKAPAKKRGAKR